MFANLKKSAFWTVLMTGFISSVALAALPANLANITTVAQMNEYLNSLKPAITKEMKQGTKPAVAVSTIIADGKSELQAGNAQLAWICFSEALSLAPTNQVALYWESIADIALDSDLNTQLQQMGIMDSNQNIILTKHQWVFPDLISFNPTQENLAEWGNNELNTAISQLNQINTTFSDTFTDSRLGKFNLDYGSVQAVLLGLNSIAFQVHMANAYNAGFAQISKNDFGKIIKSNLTPYIKNVNALYAELVNLGLIGGHGHINVANLNQYNLYQLQVYLSANNSSSNNAAAIFTLLTGISQQRIILLDLLNTYPDLLALQSSTPSELAAAKNSLLAAVNSYLSLESYVLGQYKSSGANYFVQAYTPARKPHQPLTAQVYQKDITAHQAQQQALHTLMVSIANNLTNPTQYPYVQINDPAFGYKNVLASFKINLSALFNPNRDVRGLTEVVEQELNKYHLYPNNFYDPTFGGIFSGATSADLNFLIHKGSEIGSAIITTGNGNKNIVLNWTPSNMQGNGANITGYDLYRSTSPLVNAQSTLVGHFSPNASSYSDSQIVSTTPTYYYRIYTRYLFTDETTANAYSKVYRVILNNPAPANPPVIFQIPNQTMTAGNNLILAIQGVDLNQESITWNVNIQTQIGSYDDQWGTCTPGLVVNGVPFKCPNGEIYVQVSPSAGTSGIINVTATASDALSSQSSMSFAVTVLPVTTGSIQGLVIDKTSSKILVNATVTANGKKSFVTKTNGNGQYVFNSLPLGQYTISASLIGYTAASVSANLINANANLKDNIGLVKAAVKQLK